ncbi:MAG TPA: DNA-3-methyladenine glycosylase I [Bacteroidetes bacterium]|jgi:DNA-3-methyladenine glycosylase I|nr:DNA-3-methyladenine glycosylase I [Bacteroidota bacterium]|tara:strand:+ start:206 stop:787 length:582 start_codon:yes stop_codon:yes gene_type:complete
MVKVTYDPQDNKKRCAWCLKDAQYVDYHDTEWGIPSHDDHHLFEHLILETFQAGLSWHTILKKREAFRLAFDNFSANKMASYHENEIEILVHNAAIIRHRGKIEAAIHNAKQFLRLQKQYGSFNHYIWQFTNYETIVIPIKTRSDVRSTIPQSDAMSAALKKEGFKFVGSTTCMAYMEAVGMVSDHFSDCWRS